MHLSDARQDTGFFCEHLRLIHRVRDTAYRGGREDKLGWRAGGWASAISVLWTMFCAILFSGDGFLALLRPRQGFATEDGSGGDGKMPETGGCLTLRQLRNFGMCIGL